MPIYRNLAEAVGRTPLVKLRRASEITGCEILGKAEFLNPGQSVKDRAAGVAGLAGEAEDIRAHILSFDRLMALVDSGEIDSAPLIVLAYWLERRRAGLRAAAGGA